ncbi:endonuclease/exonuclease/phosphatase family protein [Corynebacterium sp. CCM 8835]|uniref:Endonuclease/exonuclease/phosphatase family protein n=1 Tax=Corynebacterium antarcticum TaxID=2800405 RepID=A0ABS1FLC7_9CORY|nr:endonuclease/exonuclease/phosphatase family protein [Corynebacterium antarcticum]MCK7642627.1 endonuclease/exonuclease/phosphatase family protein [Corynebacterium antarcticum]MCK7660685.1 endonuclease/exonuclease/phosphatase family protein [Corynebacterium antarcticum]MCL0245431.1 endonuclease/exonuclease/phosphatase family protein [Corynebacterium antarcticum]MCX7492114.1 endonuclease/exonuclease/phosphatase family protein [Corynebacterium antarcticum]MCX7540001.1 endonuclease/exonuclease/
MRILSLCILTAALVWAFLPGNPTTTLPVIAHLTAFPVVIGAGLGLIGAVGVPRRRFRVLPVAGAVLVIAGAGSFLPVQRPTVSDAGADGDGELVVLEWNTGGSVTTENLAALIRDVHPDIAVLPEYSGEVPAGYRSFVSGGTPVTVLTADGLGDYRTTEVPGSSRVTFGTIHVSSGHPGTGKPDVIGLHTAPPLPGLMSRWRGDLGAVAALAAANPGALIIGDLNAVLRHGDLARIDTHTDAVAAAPIFGGGTWPTSLPGWARSPIDHILIPDGWSVVDGGVHIIGSGQSDHAPVVVGVRRRQESFP